MDIAETACDRCDNTSVHDTWLLRQSSECEFAGVAVKPEFLRVVGQAPCAEVRIITRQRGHILKEVRVANSAVGIDSETKTNQQLLRDIDQCVGRGQTYGVTFWSRESCFVATHKTICASIDENDGIGP